MSELKEIKRIGDLGFYSMLVMNVLFVLFSVATGSLSLLINFIGTAAAILVKIFTLISVRIMLKENKYLMPYGSGKLENFSSFLFGFTIVPMGIFSLILSINRVLTPTKEVIYLVCQIPVVLSFTRLLVLLLMTRGVLKRYPNPSPLVKAYHTDFKVAMICDAFMFAAFLIGYLLVVFKYESISMLVDPILSLALSVYMILSGLPLIIENFRSLIDLPLNEKDMLKILKVATEFYEQYEGLGTIFSRRCGKTKIVEMELMFNPEISIEKINDIESRMSARLNSDLSDVRFRLIPKMIASDSKLTD